MNKSKKTIATMITNPDKNRIQIRCRKDLNDWFEDKKPMISDDAHAAMTTCSVFGNKKKIKK